MESRIIAAFVLGLLTALVAWARFRTPSELEKRYKVLRNSKEYKRGRNF
jgi:hypothetical protein